MVIIPHNDLRNVKTITNRMEAEYVTFASGLQGLKDVAGCKLGSRDWCYILEEHGLTKDNFGKAEDRITAARVTGYLPVDFTLDDDNREVVNSNGVDSDGDIESYLDQVWRYVEQDLNHYTPERWVDYQKYYVEVLVEKASLVSLWSSIAGEFHISIRNGKGDTDVNSIADLYRRFEAAQNRGQVPILLYAGDHDPKGIQISEGLLGRFAAMEGNSFEDGTTLGPLDLTIERFGLNVETIQTLGLSKIDNLMTSGGKLPLDHPRHAHHNYPYVQSYLKQFGVWKCEANALMAKPDAGRQLFRDAIEPYIDHDAAAKYHSNRRAAISELKLAMPDHIQGKL